jgi:hypothetical protein
MVAVPVVPSITDSEECNKKKTACAHLRDGFYECSVNQKID